MTLEIREWRKLGLTFDLRIVTAVTAEFPGEGKLAELVANHVLGHEDRVKLFPVVNQKGMTHEVRRDHLTTRPCLDRALRPGFIHDVNLDQQLVIYKRSFFK